MNMALITQLVKKDWQLNQNPMIAYLVLGIIALWLIITQSMTTFAIGSILLITVVVTIGIHMVISTVTHERKNQTLTFIMSLPVSYREYTTAKMIANLIVTVGAWSFLYGMLVLVMNFIESVPMGLMPLATLTMLYLLVIYFVLLATSMISESEAVTIVVMTVMNMSISLYMMWLTAQPDIYQNNEGNVAVWTPLLKTVLASELVTIGVIIVATFMIQSRKRNFL